MHLKIWLTLNLTKKLQNRMFQKNRLNYSKTNKNQEKAKTIQILKKTCRTQLKQEISTISEQQRLKIQ